MVAMPRTAARYVTIGTCLFFALPWVGAWGCHPHTDKVEASGQDPNGRASVVSVARSAARDIPVVLEGLGTVTAFYTVTLKSQVDGRIDKILFREGQGVKKGDLLVQIDTRPFEIQLHQAEATLARDTAQLNNNRLNLERNRALRARNLVAQQTVDDQKALVDEFVGTVMADQTQVDNAKLQMDYAHIVSPIEGRTGIRLADPGNLVHANDANGLVVITQLNPITVIFTLPQDVLPQVAQQMGRTTLQAEAMSRDGTMSLGNGNVMLVDNQINTSTGTIRIKAVFNNPNDTLWPNQFVKVRLHLRTISQAVSAPASSVQRGPQGAYIYVVNASNVAEMRRVDATIQDDWAAFTKGLSIGETVVVDGQYQLRPGARVQPRFADAKPTTTEQP
jgi:multidrug efflux system membrane fusion protein